MSSFETSTTTNEKNIKINKQNKKVSKLSESIKIINNSNESIVYYLKDNVIWKRDYSAGITEQVTSSDIQIDKFNFYVNGSKPVSSNDYDQPRVTVIISGQTNPNNDSVTPTKFWVQNTITQRKLDN